MRFFFIIILLLITASSFSQNEGLSEYSVDEIKIEALEVSADIFSSPVRVTLLDRKRIESINGNNLSDILKHTPGFYIRSYGAGLSLQTLSLNGLSSGQSLILVDGQKINSSQNSVADLSLISKDEIERIEIINSGASALYGSEAITGVLNIITSKGLTSKPVSVNAKIETGSFSTGRLFTNAVINYDKMKFSASFMREYSKGDYEYYYNNGIENILKKRLNSDYRMNSYGTVLDYNLSERKFVTISGSYLSVFRNLPGIETGNAPSRSNQSDENLDFGVNFLWKGVINFSSLNYFKNHLMQYRVPGIINDHYKNYELSNRTQIEYKNFTGGIEAGYAKLNSGNIDKFDGRVKLSGFLSSTFDLTRQLKFYPSIRFDHYSDLHKSKLTTKAGFNFKPFMNRDMNFRINIGNNFRVPTFNDLYWNNAGNENLKSENSVNLDVGVIYGFHFGSYNIFNASFSYIDYSDRITWVLGSNGIWMPENIDRTASLIYHVGVESKFSAEDFNASFYGSFTSNSAVRKSGDQLDGKYLSYVPLQQIQSGFSVTVKNFGVNIDYTLYGKRFTNQSNTNYLPVVDLLDGNVSYKIKTFGIECVFRLEVDNILNEDYQLIAGYPMPLRNYRASLNFKY